jgi:hypothetical protein
MSTPIRTLSDERLTQSMARVCDLLDEAETTPEAEDGPLRTQAVAALTDMLTAPLTPRMRAQIEQALKELADVASD